MSDRGISLIEVIVCITILAVLLALLIPALGAVRRSARAGQCLAHLRQSLTAVASYQADHDDLYPISADRFDLDNAFDYAGLRLPYASQLFLWTHPVRCATGGPKLDETWLCPGGTGYAGLVRAADAADTLDDTPPGATVGSDFWLSYTLISDPRRWDPGADPADNALLRPVRASEVAFPSAKGVLVERAAQHTHRSGSALYGTKPTELVIGEPDAANTPRSAGFADASAATVVEGRDLLPGVAPGSEKPQAAILYTRNGVRGRDRP